MDAEQELILAMQQDWRFYHASHQYPTRLPAIAPREEQALQTAYPNFLSSIADVPRTRLPPRSRSGCW